MTKSETTNTHIKFSNIDELCATQNLKSESATIGCYSSNGNYIGITFGTEHIAELETLILHLQDIRGDFSNELNKELKKLTA